MAKIEEGMWLTWRVGRQCFIGGALKDAGFDHWWVNKHEGDNLVREIKPVEELVPLCRTDKQKGAYLVTLRLLETYLDPSAGRQTLAYRIPPATLFFAGSMAPTDWTSLHLVYSPSMVRLRSVGDMTIEILGPHGTAYTFLSDAAIELWDLKTPEDIKKMHK